MFQASAAMKRLNVIAFVLCVTEFGLSRVEGFHVLVSRPQFVPFKRSVHVAQAVIRDTRDGKDTFADAADGAYPVTILAETDECIVVSKPPAVVCHHSDWTGSRAQSEVPMLQRVRDAVGRRVNLVHRLDRGCSGCLLMAFADQDKQGQSQTMTSRLTQAMADPKSVKTYIALVRGEGILHGRDFRQEGWFLVDRPIKDERGHLREARTWFRFLAGQGNDRGRVPDQARGGLVLCRPETGRWHQIRKHLNGLSHPILGDSMHGSSKTNREWRERRGMLPERTCLHLMKIQMTPSPVFPRGLEATCPLSDDMLGLLSNHLPQVLEEAKSKLVEEDMKLL